MDKLQNFVIWLDGFLEATGDNINISKTNLIKNKLNGLFEHEAEKVNEKPSLQELGKKHDFKLYDGIPEYGKPHTDGDTTLFRC
jgi:hypothetical protein